MLRLQRHSAESDSTFDEKEPHFVPDPPAPLWRSSRRPLLHSPRAVLPDRRHLLQPVPFCGRKAVNFPLPLIRLRFHIESELSEAGACAVPLHRCLQRSVEKVDLDADVRRMELLIRLRTRWALSAPTSGMTYSIKPCVNEVRGCGRETAGAGSRERLLRENEGHVVA